MKTILTAAIALILTTGAAFAKLEPIPNKVVLPDKYTPEYVNSLAVQYKKITNEQIFHVALDMMEGTSADLSRKAILGFNLTQKTIKIEFKDLAQLNEDYATFDAIGWKKKGRLFIYINQKHREAPPAALAALLAHEALHQDEYNSLSEETFTWTLEANVWYEMLKRFPESNDLESSLVLRENILKQLLEKGNFSNKYIKKTVYSNKGYKNLPLTSPGFNGD